MSTHFRDRVKLMSDHYLEVVLASLSVLLGWLDGPLHDLLVDIHPFLGKGVQIDEYFLTL